MENKKQVGKKWKDCKQCHKQFDVILNTKKYKGRCFYNDDFCSPICMEEFAWDKMNRERGY